MRLALVMRKKNSLVQFAFQRFWWWSLFASGKDLVGWKGPHENLSPTFCSSSLGSEFRPDCSGYCLAGPQSRGSTTSLGSCSNSPHSDISTSSQRLFPLNSLRVLTSLKSLVQFISSPSLGYWQAALWLPQAIVSPGWAGPISSACAHRPSPPALTVLQPSPVPAWQYFSCAVGPRACVTQVALDHI